MIQVILDTNILERSPHRNSAEFHALQNLCRDRKIQLHLPDIVQKEFLSHREEAIEEGLQSIIKGIKQLNRAKVTNQSQISELASWESRLDAFKPQLIDDIYKEFAQWCEDLNIQLHKIAPHHGEAVVQAYFKGDAPFKGKRNKGIQTKKEGRGRVAFADAFIWQTILDILDKYKRVHFISNNTKDFEKLCKETKGVILHPSLEAFLLTPTVQDLFLEQFTEQNFEAILTVMQQKEADILPVLIREASKAFDTFDYDLIKDLVDPAAEISGWGRSAERDWTVKIEYDQARHYGYGIISLPIVVRIKEFDIGYSRPIQNIPKPFPANIKVHSTFKFGESASLYTQDYFPLLIYTSAEVALSVGDTDGLTSENISKLLDQARINVNQIDYVEADETKREQYDTII